MRALVTGVAGFIGSHLAEHLVANGWDVRGADSYSSYYDPAIKRRNVSALRSSPLVELVEADLHTGSIEQLLEDVDVVFHFAAQPGVRLSWVEFDDYVQQNIAVTHRLLAATAARRPLQRFVFASSSSVYGQISAPVDEDAPTRPFSPYGVTKLAADALCTAYAENFGVPTVNLRLFTVYGPRQRPDMAIHRLIRSALIDEPFEVFGDGSQVRAFTYVGDVVDAAVRSIDADLEPGTVLNISGGSSCSLREVIDHVANVVGRPVPVAYLADQAGDVTRTDAIVDRAVRQLQWHPSTGLREGIREQVTDLRDQLTVAHQSRR